MRRIGAPARPRLSAIAAASVTLALSASGCVRHEVVHYEPLTRALDGRSELHVSSYPSWFPREVSHIPFLSKTLRTPESIYFQMHVRAAGTSAGRNPHVDSILIRSFSYQRSGLPPVQLLSDHPEAFWMQEQSGEPSAPSDAVPCVPDSPVRVAILLTLNGEDYAIEDEMRCAVRERTGLLIAHALSS